MRRTTWLAGATVAITSFVLLTAGQPAVAAGPPSAPSAFALTRVPAVGYRVTWTAPDAAEAVTAYKVRFHDGGTEFTYDAASDAVSFDIDPATAGTCVDGCFVDVAAVNDVGVGASTDSLWFGGNPPGAPQNFIATEHDATVFFEWDAPVDDGGFPISSYQVEGSLEGAFWGIEKSVQPHADPAQTHYVETMPAASCVDTGCVFRVFALSAAGESAPADPLQYVAGVPPTPPVLSGDVTPLEGGGVRVQLHWTAPADMGSEQFSGYTGLVGGEGHMDFAADLSQPYDCLSYCSFAVQALAGNTISPPSNVFAAGTVFSTDDTVGHPHAIGPLNIPDGTQVVVPTPEIYEQLEQYDLVSKQYEPGNYCLRPDLGCKAGFATISGLGGWRVSAEEGTQRRPDQPSDVLPYPTGGSANDEFSVTWTPNGDGGNHVTSFDVQVQLPSDTAPTDYVPDGTPNWRTVATTATFPAEHVRCPPVVAQGVCLVRVVARNAFGLSDASDPAPLDATAVKAVADWSMPPRIADTDQNGVPDKYLLNGEQTAVVPADGKYPVIFTGCASQGQITTYSWTVDGGKPVASSRCTWRTRLPEGPHTVVLTVIGAIGGQDSDAITARIKNFLVLGLGDSYGSGEGNKHKSAADSDWDNAPCHRSVYSEQALSALKLETADPHSSVTFVHLACSGATVFKGILGAYPDPPGAGNKHQPRKQVPQITRALQLANGQRYDAVELSIGGNDMGFATVLLTCATRDNCPLTFGRTTTSSVFTASETLHKETERKLTDLPRRWSLVANCLSVRAKACRYTDGSSHRSLRVAPSHVFITEYPDPTTDTDGQLCYRSILGTFWNEEDWVGNVVLRGKAGTHHTISLTNHTGGPTGEDFRLGLSANGLDRQMALTAGALGWTFVGGISNRFVGHGYCSDQPWVIKATSLRTTTNKYGIMHPNRAGHRGYAAQVTPAMKSKLGLP